MKSFTVIQKTKNTIYYIIYWGGLKHWKSTCHDEFPSKTQGTQCIMFNEPNVLPIQFNWTVHFLIATVTYSTYCTCSLLSNSYCAVVDGWKGDRVGLQAGPSNTCTLSVDFQSGWSSFLSQGVWRNLFLKQALTCTLLTKHFCTVFWSHTSSGPESSAGFHDWYTIFWCLYWQTIVGCWSLQLSQPIAQSLKSLKDIFENVF